MVDLILFIFSLGLFCGGFWCGARYHTFSNMMKDLFK